MLLRRAHSQRQVTDRLCSLAQAHCSRSRTQGAALPARASGTARQCCHARLHLAIAQVLCSLAPPLPCRQRALPSSPRTLPNAPRTLPRLSRWLLPRPRVLPCGPPPLPSASRALPCCTRSLLRRFPAPGLFWLCPWAVGLRSWARWQCPCAVRLRLWACWRSSGVACMRPGVQCR
jgi:hypothetical protein